MITMTECASARSFYPTSELSVKGKTTQLNVFNPAIVDDSEPRLGKFRKGLDISK